MLGLSAEETEEFLRLHVIVWSDDGPKVGPHAGPYPKRHNELRAKHAQARGRDALENVAFEDSAGRIRK
jgi:hypothetical protein